MRTRAALTGALAELPPISLEDVLAEAALQVRVDRKYLVPVGVFVELVNRLRDRFAVLEIDGQRTFQYESVYFDTPSHGLYRQHLQRRRYRYKVRTRTYLDSGECSFEVKLKGNRSETIKSRLPYAASDRGRLTDPARDFLAEQLRTAYGVGPVDGLQPALVTTYRRSTLTDPTAHERLTCDIDLRFSDATRSIDVLPEAVLVESKTNGRAGAADAVLRDLRVRPIQVSKYCVAAALLNPTLRANPWHRTVHSLVVAGRSGYREA
ncbi:polyphosphate polymerase domain-containing protein [Kribbella soli]|uniref:Polyphosphate polymerase domain-containing protein n=1 Tax=Kribbella soli TaxID=1124743 RepID=A0A4R0H093_9ACTN|nr:polyphosphate polymerase domain-containing protein [Kribbella soli]TCC01592.1 polyphosphate polymerase domain-containing protein [Kribbella soli]